MMHAVLRKDILCLMRYRSMRVTQVLMVLLLAVIVLTSWPQQRTLSIAAQRQDELFRGLMLAQIALLILVVPAHASAALTSEREHETLEMLYASRLSPMQIVGGKILSTVLLPQVLLLAALPFTALLCLRGAINLADLGLAYAVLFVGSIALAAVSLAVSAFCARSQTAMAVAYALVLTVCAIAMVPAAIMLPERSGLAAAMLHYARGLSPVAALLSILQPDLFDCGGRLHGLLPLWKVYLPASAVLIVTSSLIVALRLRRPPAQAQRARRADSTLGRWWRALSLVNRDHTPHAVGRLEPMLSKELRTNRLRSAPWMIRIVYGSLCVSIALALMSLYGGIEHQDLLNYVVTVLIIFQFAAITLINPSITASVISEEIETGTFESLRMAPLRGGRILLGKFLPALPAALMPVLAMLPAYLALWYVDPAYGPYLRLLLPVVVLAAMAACLIGIACSALGSTTSRSTIAGYLITGGLFAAPLVGWLAGQVLTDDRTAARIGFLSPLAMSLAVTDRQHDNGPLSALWAGHLLFVVCLCLLLIGITRGRIEQLLRRG